MKFSCYKDDLVTALKAVMPAVAVKPQTPILSGVYLKAEDNIIEIHGNNYSNGVITKIPCSTEEGGEVVAGGQKFQEFVARFPNRTLTCTAENNSLLIQSGGANVNLLTMPVADFPKVKAVDTENTFKLRAAVLHDLIRKTVFATDKDKGARPIFTGVNFDFHDNSLTLAATNTHRISIAKTQLEMNHAPFSFVVPAAALFTLLGNVDPKDKDNFVTIGFTGRFVAFTFNNVYMTARLLEGQFPPYEKIIPTDSTTQVKANVTDLKQAVETVAVVAKESQYNTVILNISADGLIHFSADSNDIGTAEQSVDAVVSGEDLRIAFNYGYLLDVLRVVDSADINIAFNDQYSPALVTMPGDEDFQYVVMPVRT